MKPRTKHLAMIFTAGWLLVVACKHKLTNAEVKENLTNAMTQHLNKRLMEKLPNPHFTVLDVAWFEEPKYYRCEFTVKMTLPDGKDTTGSMKERISKDFASFDVPVDPGR